MAIVVDGMWLQATVTDALRTLPKMNSLHVGIDVVSFKSYSIGF
jgi:hypothetical protein